jgi:hypothetical protein
VIYKITWRAGIRRSKTYYVESFSPQKALGKIGDIPVESIVTIEAKSQSEFIKE